MLRKVFRTGNSTVVSLPKDMLEFLGLAEGSEVSVELDRERRQVIITPADTALPGVHEAFAQQVSAFIERYRPALEALSSNIPDSIFHRARVKALREEVTVYEVLGDLLARWVAGDIELASEEPTRDELVALARAARGMWADRDPDAYLAASRAGLKARDKDLEDARLDV